MLSLNVFDSICTKFKKDFGFLKIKQCSISLLKEPKANQEVPERSGDADERGQRNGQEILRGRRGLKNGVHV